MPLAKPTLSVGTAGAAARGPLGFPRWERAARDRIGRGEQWRRGFGDQADLPIRAGRNRANQVPRVDARPAIGIGRQGTRSSGYLLVGSASRRARRTPVLGGDEVVMTPISTVVAALKIDWANMPTYNTIMAVAAGVGLLT